MMTVSEAICIAEQAHVATKSGKRALTKETIALIVLAQRVRELTRAS
jgi:hypothetical protein